MASYKPPFVIYFTLDGITMRHIATALAVLVHGMAMVPALAAEYPGHETVLSLGAKRDTQALSRLRSDYLARAKVDERFVIYLASRVASPGRFSSEFIEAFPAGRNDIWPKLDHAAVDKLIPGGYELYATGELASIAVTGHEGAIRKLLQMATWADGAWAENLNGGVVQCLLNAPAPTLKELSLVEPGERMRVVNNAFELQLTDRDVPRLLTALSHARHAASEVASAIEQQVRKRRRNAGGRSE